MVVYRVLVAVGVLALVIGLVAAHRMVAESPVTSYPWHPGTMASVFDSSENPRSDNAFIGNAQSAWDKDWRTHAPNENVYFVAVPYGDYLSNGTFNPDNKRIPWHTSDVTGQSELKNRWVQIERKVDGKTLTAFGQVEDTGPSDHFDTLTMSDPDYVFGPPGHDPSSPILVKPKNTFGLRAGIDVSPAIAQLLRLDGSGTLSWRFVDKKDVRSGPWTVRITVSPPNW